MKCVSTSSFNAPHHIIPNTQTLANQQINTTSLTKFREKKRNRMEVPRIAAVYPEPSDVAIITYHVRDTGGVQACFIAPCRFCHFRRLMPDAEDTACVRVRSLPLSLPPSLASFPSLPFPPSLSLFPSLFPLSVSLSFAWKLSHNPDNE